MRPSAKKAEPTARKNRAARWLAALSVLVAVFAACSAKSEEEGEASGATVGAAASVEWKALYEALQTPDPNQIFRSGPIDPPVSGDTFAADASIDVGYLLAEGQFLLGTKRRNAPTCYRLSVAVQRELAGLSFEGQKKILSRDTNALGLRAAVWRGGAGDQEFGIDCTQVAISLALAAGAVTVEPMAGTGAVLCAGAVVFVTADTLGLGAGSAALYPACVAGVTAAGTALVGLLAYGASYLICEFTRWIADTQEEPIPFPLGEPAPEDVPPGEGAPAPPRPPVGQPGPGRVPEPEFAPEPLSDPLPQYPPFRWPPPLPTSTGEPDNVNDPTAEPIGIPTPTVDFDTDRKPQTDSDPCKRKTQPKDGGREVRCFHPSFPANAYRTCLEEQFDTGNHRDAVVTVSYERAPAPACWKKKRTFVRCTACADCEAGTKDVAVAKGILRCENKRVLANKKQKSGTEFVQYGIGSAQCSATITAGTGGK